MNFHSRSRTLWRCGERAARTAVRFGIRGLPVFALFKNGELVDQRTGAVLGAKLDDLLKQWSVF